MKRGLISLTLVISMVFSAAFVKAGNLKTELLPVFNTYRYMMSEFVKSSPQAIHGLSLTFEKDIKAVDVSKLSGKELATWKSESKRMLEGNKVIMNGQKNNIELQRRAFATISKSLYNCIKASGGVANLTVYYYYSKEAVNGTGAYWLSAQKNIINPYMGERDINEGTLKETIK